MVVVVVGNSSLELGQRVSQFENQEHSNPVTPPQKKQKAYNEALLYTKELLNTYSERELINKKNYVVSDPFIEDFVRAFKHKDTIDNMYKEITEALDIAAIESIGTV